jgi:hypothetical protein
MSGGQTLAHIGRNLNDKKFYSLGTRMMRKGGKKTWRKNDRIPAVVNIFLPLNRLAHQSSRF